MRCLIAFLLLSIATPGYGVSGARVIKDLASPPPGTTLPVVINRTLKAHNLRPGEPISAPLIQSVPVGANLVLPRGAKLDGHIVKVSDSSISILFDHLSWKERTIPVNVRLVAAAAMMNVYDTGVPLSGPDRGTANRGDWTTQQIGGDQIFLSAGSGTVYDKYSQPVGYANLLGVYANPLRQANCPVPWGHSPQLQPASTASPNFPLHLREAPVRPSRSPQANPTGSFEMAAPCSSR
jgi:hypothetical protein